MMDWTDRHCRYFMRLISPDILLYTDMLTSAALVRGQGTRLLAFDPREHPVALQLGGSDRAELAKAAEMGQKAGFDEINLNVGCPSDRVQSGRFGACLMAEPDLVANCVASMRESLDIPVTVKSRIGIDERDDYEFLLRFVDVVAGAGCETFVVHARKAILSGLSPKQNREIPPLVYERVWELKKDRPALDIIVNGGIRSCDEVETHLNHVDGAMLGREAYHNPYLLAHLQQRFFPRSLSLPSREEIVVEMLPYIAAQLASGERLHRITRHMLGLYCGQPGARRWRRFLSENAVRPGAGVEIVTDSLRQLPAVA